jgi:DNA-binding GntR family transcriptional regulator
MSSRNPASSTRSAVANTDVNIGAPPRHSGRKVPVVDVLRDAIRQRLVPPGTPLIQQDVAAALGVSRIPVREALQSLAAEGIVEFSDDGGARVFSLTADEIDELFALRLLIEPAMADAIVRNVSDSDIGYLGDLVAQMDTYGEADPPAWANANHVFHEHLYRSADQRHYFRFARQLLTLVDPYARVAVFHLHGREASQLEHHAMIGALQDRNGEELRQLTHRHISRARVDLIAYATRGDEVRATDAAERFANRLFAADEPVEH